MHREQRMKFIKQAMDLIYLKNPLNINVINGVCKKVSPRFDDLPESKQASIINDVSMFLVINGYFAEIHSIAEAVASSIAEFEKIENDSLEAKKTIEELIKVSSDKISELINSASEKFKEQL